MIVLAWVIIVIWITICLYGLLKPGPATDKKTWVVGLIALICLLWAIMYVNHYYNLIPD
jgi:quinol-cytochrome oxidoreductase complex cytochrome b subunit